jgi:hypothetical protein
MSSHITRTRTRATDSKELPVRPTKFTQRLAVVLAMAIITVCVAVIATLGGGNH